jgi:hypothetical protein
MVSLNGYKEVVWHKKSRDIVVLDQVCQLIFYYYKGQLCLHHLIYIFITTQGLSILRQWINALTW